MTAVLVGLVLVPGAMAQQNEPLHGHWQITMPSNDDFSGGLVIDAQGRVAYMATVNAKSWPAVGYIARKTASRIEIPLTNTTTKSVARMRCSVQSTKLLTCDTVEADGQTSPQFYMRRSAAEPDATDVRGRWRIPFSRDFSIHIDVDARRQAVVSIPGNDNFRASGYVWVDGTSVRFIFNKRVRVSATEFDSVVCRAEASDILRCATRKDGETAKTSFLVTRVGG